MALRASCHGLFGLLARRRASPAIQRAFSPSTPPTRRTPPIVLGGSFAPSLELRWSRSALQFAETIIEREIERHCRTIPFFWPMRASSWNQISTGLPLATPGLMSIQRSRKVFLNAATVRSS